MAGVKTSKAVPRICQAALVPLSFQYSLMALGLCSAKV
jgi:hypothetical protein